MFLRSRVFFLMEEDPLTIYGFYPFKTFGISLYIFRQQQLDDFFPFAPHRNFRFGHYSIQAAQRLSQRLRLM